MEPKFQSGPSRRPRPCNAANARAFTRSRYAGGGGPRRAGATLASVSRRGAHPLRTMNTPDSERPVLITGGAGFVGTTLTSGLLAADRHVVIYDNFFTT